MSLNVKLDLSSPNIKESILVRTNVNGWFFDGYVTLDHSQTARATDHPVQRGANISDHIFVEPYVLQITIINSECQESFINGQFSNSWSRSASTWEVLKELQKQKVLCTILTRLGKYENMFLESISTTDTIDNLYDIQATCTFKEILIANTSVVKATFPSNPVSSQKVSPPTQQGAKTVSNVSSGGGGTTNKSVLKKMSEKVGK